MKMKKIMAKVRGGSRNNTNQIRRVGKYEIGNTLGTGNSSIVKLATHVDTGHTVAIKILDKKKFRRKRSVLRNIQIRNSDQDGRTGMTESQARKYFQQLMSAVDYCHSRGVTHRDLKPENLLVDENGVLKVSDFGMSALPEQVRPDGLLHSACGTPHYVAPELITNNGYDGAKADIWSCGVILFFMNAGDLPFRSDNDSSSSDEDVVYQKRITMNEIFEDEWFKTNYQPPRFSQENIDFDVDSQNLIAEVGEAGPSAPLPVAMNAIDIMHTFLGIVMANLFYQVYVKREARFVCKSSATDIVEKIESVARTMGFDVKKRYYQMSITIREELAGRKGQLSIATEVYEMIPMDPPYHMVEFQKVVGDTLEFHKFYKDLRAELQDIIWIAEPVDIETKTDGQGSMKLLWYYKPRASTSTAGTTSAATAI
ncbi:hypothetical protein VNO78_11156 [Psophocarpus tetragonolobus]|uniref:Protein kinase domain-containing protein n=1 Tax=Psophocarpus tetragonolobus TaxID=3891 RepID=A0AAN9SSL5_PSOTE